MVVVALDGVWLRPPKSMRVKVRVRVRVRVGVYFNIYVLQFSKTISIGCDTFKFGCKVLWSSSDPPFVFLKL